MNTKALFFSFATSLLLAIPVIGGSAIVTPVQAYDGCETCDRLWYQRNAIYARKGYCFKTRRARAVFGRRCYPPYGSLSRRERRRVERIKWRERDLRCRRMCR